MGGVANMNGQEAAATWRLFRFNWLLTASILAAFGLSLLLTRFQIRPVSYLVVFAVAAVYGMFGYRNAASPQRLNPRLGFTLTAIAQTILIISGMLSLSYIATSANFPLRDQTLLAIDRAAGLDFCGYLGFINDRRWLVGILALGYRAIEWPIWLVVIALPLAGHCRRAGEFICAFTLALMATTCISTLIPATGVYGTIGLVAADFPNIEPLSYYDGMREIPALRDGSLRVLDLTSLAGVLTFPSFHAISAVLYAWALWPIRRLRPLNLFCNGAMLIATPVGGGHYFIDVIAGIGVAVGSIHAARRISGTATIPVWLNERPAILAKAAVPENATWVLAALENGQPAAATRAAGCDPVSRISTAVTSSTAT
jgi:hypothetical protein